MLALLRGFLSENQRAYGRLAGPDELIRRGRVRTATASWKRCRLSITPTPLRRASAHGPPTDMDWPNYVELVEPLTTGYLTPEDPSQAEAALRNNPKR